MIEAKIDEGITTKQMLSRLKLRIREAGSQAALAKKWKVPPQSISNALACSKLPSPIILENMNLVSVKEIKYRYKDAK